MDNIDVLQRKIGVNFRNGNAEINIWAPDCQVVSLILAGKTLNLEKGKFGYWHLATTELKPGGAYYFGLEDKSLADIYALQQPDVQGASIAVDLADFKWTDQDWQNPALDSYILYELHTGTFTTEGDFAGIEQKLDHLLNLGITAVELMPVAQFPGDRNWGYDGVFPFAVQQSYGGAKGLRHLVNACHHKGLAVILDVVYNHIGPEGNYLGLYGPYFTEKYQTPWGNALNFDDAGCDPVRRFFIENALMWFRDFHIDALRLDAVHAIKDFSPKHILQEIKEYTDQLSRKTGRPHYLIVECDLNDTRFINPISEGGFGMNAQWTDEFHHALRVAAGGKQEGYYADFNGLPSLAESYQHAYVYHGEYSEHRRKNFGVDPLTNAGWQFVVFSQNHDQVGNRMLGERSSQLFSVEMQQLMAAAVMVSPFLPMLFMGEEWGASSPFQYFVSHSDEKLVQAVREGRKAEFRDFQEQGETPDPQSEDTFIVSKLKWGEIVNEPNKNMFNYYRALISLRKQQPALRYPDRKNLEVTYDDQAGTMVLRRWCAEQQLICLMNFSKTPKNVQTTPDIREWQQVFDSADPYWRGRSGAPVFRKRATDTLVAPESITIYSQYHV
jgi:maltooligosyltrehalose trehalohydrolase